MIDWSKPVETDEEKPRPVQVLFGVEGRPKAAYIDDNHSHSSLNLFTIEHVGAGVNATRGMYSIRLRNVQPKKVKREGWVVVSVAPTGIAWSRSKGAIFDTESEAEETVRNLPEGANKSYVCRIEWEGEED